MKLEKHLTTINNYHMNFKKEKKRRAEELRDIALRCLKRGALTAVQYAKICNKNGILMF